MSFWHNGIFRFFLFAALVYWIGAFFAPETLRIIVDAASLGLAIMVALTWAPGAYFALKSGGSEQKWQGLFGIFLLSLTLAVSRIWAVGVRAQGYPDWMVNSPINGFLIMCTGAALYSLFLSGNLPQAERPSPIWRWSLISVGAAGIIVGVIVARFPF